jgi:RimJ/RimL family protein N-acetyltransferase
MGISYRKLAAEDAIAYRNIRLESLKAHPESFGSTYEAQSKLPHLMFEKALVQPYDERFVLGAFSQDELIGICGFVPSNDFDLPHTGTLIQMYVRVTYRGRRIGLNLVKEVLQTAFNIPDMEKVILGVNAGNLSAIRVYEQAGFQTYQSETNDDEYHVMIIHRSG